MSTSELGTAAEIAWPRFASVIVGKLIIGRLTACPPCRSSTARPWSLHSTSSNQTPSRMAADPRISDRELAAINAAAVTREYRVQPHLGASVHTRTHTAAANVLLQTIAPSQPSTGKLGRYGHAVWSLICI